MQPLIRDMCRSLWANRRDMNGFCHQTKQGVGALLECFTIDAYLGNSGPSVSASAACIALPMNESP